MDGSTNGPTADGERTTDHRVVDRQLRESEHRLALAQRAGRVGVFDWDVAANDIFATAETEAIYGMPPGIGHYAFETFMGLVHPEDRVRLRAEIDQGFSAHQPEMSAEFRIVRPDGEVRHLAQRAIASYDDAGRARRVVGTSLDITERKLAEETLRRSEEKFARAFHLSPDSINLNRLRDGVYLEINEGFERITGWTRADVLGRSSLPDDLGIWVRAEDRARMVAELSARGEVTDFAAEFRRKDGSILPGLMAGRILEVNGEACVLSITRDLTQHKLVEARLEQQNAVLSALINSTEDRIFSVDRNYRYTQFNASHARFMKRLVGKEIELGANILEFEPNAVIRGELKQNMDRSLAGERVEIEYTAGEPRDRRLFWISHNQVRAPNGEVIGVAVFARDLTDQRRLQEQLLHAQKMEAIGLLAGGIAHDFRNQLTIIKGFCELLRESRDVLPGGRFLLDEILKAAQQSTDMTGKLLGFSRKQLLQPQLVDVSERVAEACHMLPRLLREDVKLVFSGAAGPVRAVLDPVQLQQAIFNLATNARDAMPRGGELRIACRTMTPDAAFRRRHGDAQAEGYVTIAVSDSGPGMDEATLARIFEPFFTTKPTGQGTGLGLAMVYGFVKQCAGIIDVQSTPGAGSTFSLYFPEVRCVEEAGVGPAPAASDDGNLSGRERILVVEDDAAVRHVVLRFLAAAGYDAVESTDARHALALLGDPGEAFDLLLSDVVMPELSGTDLAQRARALRPDLAVLLVSGYSNAQLLQRGLQEVNGTYLAKPFGRADLLRAVRRSLHGRTEEFQPH